MEWGDTVQQLFLFLAYTMINVVFYTANNIAYGALTALINKNDNERIRMDSLRFVFSFSSNLLIQSVTVCREECLSTGISLHIW